MAAIHAVASLVRHGEEILACRDLYGGTYRLLSTVVEQSGVGVRLVDTEDPDELARSMSPKTRLVLIETPTNPYLRINDLRSLADRVHQKGCLFVVDNSLLSPYFQKPLDLGADIVIHSATKYLSGHSDVTAGFVATSDPKLGEKIAFYQNAAGAGLAPFDSWLLLRGLRTLALRLDRQQATASRLYEFLERQPEVVSIHYPGVGESQAQAIHRSQSSGSGGLLSFETHSEEFAVQLLESLTLFNITVSFGGVASSISIPAHMSHAYMNDRGPRSVLPNLVRLSAGIEHVDDLLEDLDQAFTQARS